MALYRDMGDNACVLIAFIVLCTYKCHAQPPPPKGWGNTGELTKSSVKFPSTGAKKLVRIPLCPHLESFYREFGILV